MKKVDLHFHSLLSDGVYSLEELANLCANQWKVEFVSLTDHNCVDGIEQFTVYAKKNRIKNIPGVEISSTIGGRHVHIMGYNFNPNNKELKAALMRLQKDRRNKILKTAQAMSQDGFEISAEAIAELETKYLGLVHIIRLLNQSSSNIQRIKEEVGTTGLFSVINYYFAKGQKYYQPEIHLPAKVVISLIKEAGGFSSLAHPGTHLPHRQCRKYVEKLAKLGLNAIEAITPLHTWDQVVNYQTIARSLHLDITAGSNFHEEFRGEYAICDPHQYFQISLKNLPIIHQ